MLECAVREAFEETGMHLLNDADAGGSIPYTRVLATLCMLSS